MKIASIVSTKGGPGKTTVTANLGAFCADANIRTLLIDLDTQPSLSSFYRIDHEAPGGTYQLIAQNNTRPEQVISRTCIPNLSLIVSNDPYNQLSNLLLHAADGRLRLKNLVTAFADDFDLILIDTQGARFVVLEMALLCSDLAISPITPDMLAAREFYRGTQQLLKDLEPLAVLGVYTPPLNIVINKLDATNDASLIYQSLTETLADHPQINLLQTTLPAAVSFRRAATEGVPAHRLEFRQPLNRRSPSAFNVIKALALELFPEWKAQFDLLTDQTLNPRRKADQEVAS
ncbi:MULTISPECIES: ParA family protein [unclassified Pseudomonas]|uniref:ParA family protein n=1 Tax=unclassified Pseudomonas TaxID=196821 RepID=UPI002B2294A1|nr:MULTISPECIES: ParA family protein [unclassified Pseudomonas]MEA9976512.1 ParA family protein [Pseudomonas sp. RTS4]MEB0198350.1 ParA family protein [Pseudomonas sp. 5S4]MEB0244065.1 ParA family protein [Pseudomonas sp. 10S5]